VADYVIGDIQGCYDALQRLLDVIAFNDRQDTLWFVGDLVNRGPQSLAVLRFILQLPIKPRITLGNHDLHLLHQIFCPPGRFNQDDTLLEILKAPDHEAIGHWLRHQSLLVHDPLLNVVMCHAGISPQFNLLEAKSAALELEAALSGEFYLEFLSHIYGNTPDSWEDSLGGNDRLRYICNAFTRMRFCDIHGRLMLNYKGSIENADPNLYPWFLVPQRKSIAADIVFGHWAALEGQCPDPHIYAIDTGCFWGGTLTALRLQDKQRFAVRG